MHSITINNSMCVYSLYRNLHCTAVLKEYVDVLEWSLSIVVIVHQGHNLTLKQSKAQHHNFPLGCKEHHVITTEEKDYYFITRFNLVIDKQHQRHSDWPNMLHALLF